jgi:prepilin-type N-terminal cleavage/methylation domain-containing protein
MAKIKITNKAFSLIELSIVILIIGILVAGVTQSSRLVKQFRIQAIRQLTINSPISAISNLNLWLETTLEKSFNDTETSHGSTITKWYDINPQSSFKNDAFQNIVARAPTYNSNEALPLVNFNGNGDGQFFNLPDNTIPSGDSAFTIFFAIRLAKDATARFHDILLAGLWSNPVTLLRIDNGSGFKFSIFSGGGSTTLVWPKTPNQQLGTLILFTAGYNNTNQRSFLINVNGVLATQMNVPDARSTGTNYNMIGGNPWVNFEYFRGDIAELVIFSKFLSTEERQAVEAYIMKKWSIK